MREVLSAFYKDFKRCIIDNKVNTVLIKEEGKNSPFLVATNISSSSNDINSKTMRISNTNNDDLYSSIISNYTIVSEPRLLDFQAIAFPVTIMPILIKRDNSTYMFD